jgi:hypothetical protein
MKCRLAVLVADGQPDSVGECFLGEGVTLPETDVPVYLEFQRTLGGLIGRAKLSKEGHVVFAEMDLVDMKLPPHAPRILYPAVGGKVFEREEKVIKKCKVTDIGLSITPNADRRIQTMVLQGVPDNVRPKKQEAAK